MSYKEHKCKIDGCSYRLKLGRNGNRYLIKGYCNAHYERHFKGLMLDGSDQKHIKFGQTKHELRATWTNMMQRCNDTNSTSYSNYGGRGIKVCERWQGVKGFSNFVLDMGKRPEGTTLDRINNDGNYSAENCRWANRKEQALNRRSNKFVTYKGITKTIFQWADETGYKRSTFSQRYYAYGWDIGKCINTPVKARR